jgi:ankyrin repeat protein
VAELAGHQLHQAAYWSGEHGNTDVLELLLRKGADKSAKDDYGGVSASWIGSSSVAYHLLE